MFLAVFACRNIFIIKKSSSTQEVWNESRVSFSNCWQRYFCSASNYVMSNAKIFYYHPTRRKYSKQINGSMWKISLLFANRWCWMSTTCRVSLEGERKRGWKREMWYDVVERRQLLNYICGCRPAWTWEIYSMQTRERRKNSTKMLFDVLKCFNFLSSHSSSLALRS